MRVPPYDYALRALRLRLTRVAGAHALAMAPAGRRCRFPNAMAPDQDGFQSRFAEDGKAVSRTHRARGAWHLAKAVLGTPGPR